MKEDLARQMHNITQFTGLFGALGKVCPRLCETIKGGGEGQGMAMEGPRDCKKALDDCACHQAMLPTFPH